MADSTATDPDAYPAFPADADGFKRMDWALDAPLPLAEHSVMVALVWHTSPGNPTCYPSQATLARRSAMKTRNVRYALGRLETKGWIQIEHATGRRFFYRIRSGSPIPLNSPLSPTPARHAADPIMIQ